MLISASPPGALLIAIASLSPSLGARSIFHPPPRLLKIYALVCDRSHSDAVKHSVILVWLIAEAAFFPKIPHALLSYSGRSNLNTFNAAGPLTFGSTSAMCGLLLRQPSLRWRVSFILGTGGYLTIARFSTSYRSIRATSKAVRILPSSCPLPGIETPGMYTIVEFWNRNCAYVGYHNSPL